MQFVYGFNKRQQVNFVTRSESGDEVIVPQRGAFVRRVGELGSQE